MFFVKNHTPDSNLQGTVEVTPSPGSLKNVLTRNGPNKLSTLASNHR